jgi:hypothetical protein
LETRGLLVEAIDLLFDDKGEVEFKFGERRFEEIID